MVFYSLRSHISHLLAFSVRRTELPHVSAFVPLKQKQAINVDGEEVEVEEVQEVQVENKTS